MKITAVVALLLTCLLLPVSASASSFVVKIDPTLGGCRTVIEDNVSEGWSAVSEQCQIYASVYSNGTAAAPDPQTLNLWCFEQSCYPTGHDDCLASYPLAAPPHVGESIATCGQAIADGGIYRFEVDLTATRGFIFVESLTTHSTISTQPLNDGRD